MFFKLPKKIRGYIREYQQDIADVKQIIDTSKELFDMVKDIETKATPKSVGGMTSLHLKNIMEDFSNFQNQDAEAAIRTFIIEFLNIKYGTQTIFEKSRVNKNILLNIQKDKKKNISNITINGISIHDYNKTQDYATITYKCSFGYDLDGIRQEERYIINYSLQLSDFGDGQNAMRCEFCGAPINREDKNECSYCGTKIIMDIIMNWSFTKLVED